MKLSNIILSSSLAIFVGSIFASNFVMKREFDKVDKNDPYWNYEKINSEPFNHLVINGGNISNIAFEENTHPSVKTLKTWRGSHDNSISARVSNDTLYVNFTAVPENLGEKFWLMRATPVRIFSPKIVSLSGNETNLSWDKFNQKNIKVDLSGKSKLSIRSYNNSLDEVEINGTDSAQVALTMSRDIEGPAELKINHLTSNLQGKSLLDMRTAAIGSLNINVGDTAGILLTGSTLNGLKR